MSGFCNIVIYTLVQAQITYRTLLTSTQHNHWYLINTLDLFTSRKASSTGIMTSKMTPSKCVLLLSPIAARPFSYFFCFKTLISQYSHATSRMFASSSTIRTCILFLPYISIDLLKGSFILNFSIKLDIYTFASDHIIGNRIWHNRQYTSPVPSVSFKKHIKYLCGTVCLTLEYMQIHGISHDYYLIHKWWICSSNFLS